MKLGKRIAAGVLACAMAMSMLTACGGGGGGGGNGSASSGNSGTSTPSASSGSSSGTLTPSSSGSDVNMGGGAGSGYASSRLKAISDKYAAGVMTIDADIVDSDGTKFNMVATLNGSNSYMKYTLTGHAEDDDGYSVYETESERWDKNGIVYYYSSQLSKYWEEDNKIIVEITPDAMNLIAGASAKVGNTFYSDDAVIDGTFVALGMQSAPSSFTDGKKYYAEQVDYNVDGARTRTTAYFEGNTVVYASTIYLATGDKTDIKYNSLSPTFDSAKMTVGGTGYRIVDAEELIVKGLTTDFIDPDNKSSDDSSNKEILAPSSYYGQMISYLRSLESPSAATKAWLAYYDSL